MKLLIDIGNTRLKWRSDTAAGTVDDARDVTALDAAFGRLNPDQVLVSDVRHGRDAETLKSYCHSKWELTPVFAQTTAEAAGVRCAYPQPTNMGVDRWLAAIAAWREFGAAVIADIGTALTLDAVNQQGEHLGGLIAAGPDLACSAVVGRAEGVFVDGPKPEVTWCATATPEAIWSGSVLACASLIDGFFTQAAPAEARLVICGGQAPLIRTYLSHHALMREDLVLSGLAIWGQEQGQ